MPKIEYIQKNFNPKTEKIIAQANEIIDEYAQQGFDLTLRQLYYQFVSRDLLANKQTEYKRLGSIINDARLAGEIDWDTIVDRTRNLQSLPVWESPANIINACAKQFRLDKWEGQRYRPEVWIEKDALVGVIEGVCAELQVPYFSCRGYTSQSEMWSAAQRLIKYTYDDQVPFIIHLGDHDPSGIDMSRDIEDRLTKFMAYEDCALEVERIALNMNQVQLYSPPPNPTKITDSRASGYLKLHGTSSWELDALEPRVMSDLIRSTVLDRRDEKAWSRREEEEKKARRSIQLVAANWYEIEFALLEKKREGVEEAEDAE